MSTKPLNVASAVLGLLVALSSQVWAESGNYLPLESLLGKFEGVIQVENAAPVPHDYQTEVTAVDTPGNTVTLTASCLDCGIKRWTRSKCGVTAMNERISFTCKGPKSDEAYIFNGKEMTATGFGNKFPYSIRVSKLN
jgi:hypothetical protein